MNEEKTGGFGIFLIGVAMILIGPAGIGAPVTERLKEIKKLGLTAAEVEFTHGVRMNNTTAKEIGLLAKNLEISLSVHAPYYINLASMDNKTLAISKRNIINSCERAHYLRARHVVFHPAYYGKLSKEECYDIVKTAIIDLQKIIMAHGWDVVLCPETTGKQSQFGDLDELIKLSKETGCGICIDFAHLEARHNRKLDYYEVLKKIKNIKEKTAHFSGIEYTEKGERRHIKTPEEGIKELLIALKKQEISITIINESPQMIEDCIKTLMILERT